jgi:hypothetical protein
MCDAHARKAVVFPAWKPEQQLGCWLGPNRKDRIGFLFSEIILNAKTISENLEIVLKA